MNKGFLLAVGLLSGTIIGAGIFSLPYVVNQLGLVPGVFYLLFFAFVYFIVFKMYAALTLTTNEEHRFFYLADKFLPRRFAGLASLVIITGLIFTLTIYLILAVSFFGLIGNFSVLATLLIFWLFGSVFIFVKLDWQGVLEVFGIGAILAIVGLIFFSGHSLPDTPLFRSFDLPIFLLPFGPLLFAYSARVAIPKVVGEWKKRKAAGRPFSLGKALLAGSFLPAAVYLVFVFGVLRLTPDVAPEALSGLSFLPPAITLFLGVLGILTLWTSYFMIGSDVRETLKYDLRSPAWLSSLVVLVLPLGLYLTGFQNFLTVLELTGGVFLGLEGIFIIAMWRRAFPSHQFRKSAIFLYIVFFLALVYSLVDFVL